MRVRYTQAALDDLRQILDFVADYSPQGKTRVQAKLVSCVELLATYPFAGSRTDDPLLRRMVARPFPYLIYYDVNSDEVVIQAIRHAARARD